MNILIITFLLVVAVKQLVCAGLFIDTNIKVLKIHDDIKAGVSVNELELPYIASVLLMTIPLIVSELYSFLLGISIPALVIPTIIMFAHMVYRTIQKKSRLEDLGKYTLFSVAEGAMRVSYYAYFLYVLI